MKLRLFTTTLTWVGTNHSPSRAATWRKSRLRLSFHAKQVDTTQLCSYKQRIEHFYREKNRVPEDYKQRVLKFLDTVPDAALQKNVKLF